jgi:hypothetical protein
MASFDPMAAAIDWLDAYRAASISIVRMYAEEAALECGCGGAKVLYGQTALTEYWRQRFVEKPAGELTDLRLEGDDIVVGYRTPDGIVEAILTFDGEGNIRCSRCGPTTADVTPLDAKDGAGAVRVRR